MSNEKTKKRKNLKTKKQMLEGFFVLWFFSSSVLQFFSPSVLRFTALAQEETKNEEKISLDLKGVEIAELFKMLSAKSGYTIIATPEVRGRVTVFLNNLGFNDVLEVVLNLQDLACERNGNLVKVMTSAEYEKSFGAKYGERKKVKTIKLAYAKPSNIANVISSLKSEVGKIIVDDPSGILFLIDSPPALAAMESAIKELDAPLETAVFDLNYANVNDIKSYLNDLITPGVGQLIIDTRSDKAVVSDLPERLARIKKLMQEFDEASRQVLITGEIVEVTLNDKFQRGIEWEQLLSQRKWDGLDLVGKFPFSSGLSGYGKLSIGTLGRDDYNVIIKLLQEYGDTKIISRPRIVAVNKQEAKIMVGSREAYVTQTQSQATSTTVTSEAISFIDVGVKLGVVPTIGKDGFITMKIKPEVSSVRETLKTSSGSQIPIVETSETETVVKVKDGSMIMLGGLLKEEKRDDSSGLPAVSRIPWIGGLFGTRARQNKKTELVIFLSPRLISGENQLSVNKVRE